MDFAEIRFLLTGAAAEAIHDSGMCDYQARLVELCEADRMVLELAWPDLSPAESEIWMRIHHLFDVDSV